MKFYITTPLYYVNALPHIGHAYTTLAADCLARFHRMKGEEVFFLTGTDEHGQKIADAAAEKGISPQQLSDEMSGKYKELWQQLKISYSRFIRTTEPAHEQIVRKVFKSLLDKGDLYIGEYKGFYCVHCESYVTPDKETEQPVCPDCKRETRPISEPSYFFRLSKYQKRLLDYIEKTPDFIKPDFRKNEVMNFIRTGLKDLSITRKACSWGIQLPGEEKLTVYVWFDALLNYLSGIGYLDDETIFQKLWPPDVQLMAKDIIRFHCIIWPAILMSLEMPLPKTIFAHGWWIMGKEKISKSKGNAVDPRQLLEEYGIDPYRFFLMREIPFGLDGTYSEEHFKKRYNSDLVNDLGNLVNRTLHIVEKEFEGLIPKGNEDKDFQKLFEEVFVCYSEKMTQLSFSKAIEEIWKLPNYLNRFLDKKTPWKAEKEQAGEILYQVMEGIRLTCLLLFPFIPDTSEKIWNMLGIKQYPDKVTFELKNERLKSGKNIGERTILFPRKA